MLKPIASMSTAARTSRRRAALVAALAALLALGLAASPASAKRKPPRIGPMPVALFNAEDETLGFSVTVFRAKSVTIHYGERLRKAEQIPMAGGDEVVVPFGWEASFSDATRKRCYRIEVVARNGNRTAERSLDACRLGSPTREPKKSDSH